MKSSQHTPLRIGFDATWLVQAHKSGVGYYLQNLITTLAAAHPDDLILTGHYYAGSRTSETLLQAPNLNYQVSRLLPLKLVNMLRRVHIEVPFELLLKKRSDFLLFPAYTSYPSLFRTPSTVVIYDLAFRDMPETLSPRNQQDLVRNVPHSLARARFITTISNWTKQRLMDTYHLTKPMVVTYIPPLPPKPVPDAAATVRALNITKPFILFVGTLEPRKNILGLLSAYEMLPAELRISYSLVLAGGEGWQDDAIKQKLHQLAQEGFDIIPTGYVSDEQKEALYDRATVLALVSFYEGFGMTLLEAMTHGTAVLASDIPVFHEVCGAGAAYVDPNNQVAITDSLSLLLRSSADREKLIAAGKQNLERFSWDSVVHAVYDQIKQTLA
jgi:glycosyltransferase involved in cell wall biosynthesis